LSNCFTGASPSG